MKFSLRLLYVSAVSLLLLASCAKEESGSYNESEKMALKAWIKINRPDLAGNIQPEGGYYVDVLEVGNLAAAPVNDTICWVKFDFSGRDLNGNIVLTRNEVEARQMGTFTKYTHYTPYYRYCGNVNTSLLEGTHLAMRNKLTLDEEYYQKYKDERGFPSKEISLREGTKVVLYMPSSIVGEAGVEGDGGYEGQFTLSSKKPFIVTMEIVDTVKNPLESEGSAVDVFAKNNGGLLPLGGVGDKTARRAVGSLTRGADEPQYNDGYAWRNAVDSIPQVYVNHIYEPENPNFSFAESKNNPYKSLYAPYNDMAKLERDIADTLFNRFGSGTLDGDSVKLEGKAKIWYIGRFLDGFVFDTNIDGIKKLVYGEIKSKGSVISYTPSEGGMIMAWYYAIPQLRFGQWATIITTSTNAYGSAGKSGGSQTSGGGSNAGYYDYMNYYNYANSYYGGNGYGGGGYYGGYYDNYYGNYGGGMYGGYDYGSGAESETTTSVSTEISPFTPLIFQIFIETENED